MDSITLLAVLFLSLSYYGVRGSVVEIAGDIFDCVDLGNQPAFDHPLLKNHIADLMHPTSYLMQRHKKITCKTANCKACPEGTVPIQRTRPEDLIRAKSYILNSHSVLTGNVDGYRALIRSKTTDKKYFGAEGQINIQNPPVGPGQFSSAQIWIESADLGANFNALQAGWAVSQELYNDSRTRLFIYSKGSDPKVDCFNLHCSGFVQVDRSHPIGGLVEPVSKYGGEQHELALAISLDPKTKDWWLVNWGGLSRDDYIHYGYWPKELFPSFQGGADYVAWGGAVHPGKNETSPPMGTGHFDGNFVQTSYIKEIEVYVDENGNLANPIVSSFAPLAENSKCFGVQDLGYDDDSLYRFTFGGPGGICRA